MPSTTFMNRLTSVMILHDLGLPVLCVGDTHASTIVPSNYLTLTLDSLPSSVFTLGLCSISACSSSSSGSIFSSFDVVNNIARDVLSLNYGTYTYCWLFGSSSSAFDDYLKAACSSTFAGSDSTDPVYYVTSIVTSIVSLAHLLLNSNWVGFGSDEDSILFTGYGFNLALFVFVVTVFFDFIQHIVIYGIVCHLKNALQLKEALGAAPSNVALFEFTVSPTYCILSLCMLRFVGIWVCSALLPACITTFYVKCCLLLLWLLYGLSASDRHCTLLHHVHHGSPASNRHCNAPSSVSATSMLIRSATMLPAPLC